MTSNQLVDLLENQAHLSSTSMDELRQLKDKYPYFQTAYLLLAKKAVDNNAYEQQHWVQAAATFGNSRAVLYNLLNNRDLSQQNIDALVTQEDVEQEDSTDATSVEQQPLVRENMAPNLVEPEELIEADAEQDIQEETVVVEEVPELPEEEDILATTQPRIAKEPTLVTEDLPTEAYERRLQAMLEEDELPTEEIQIDRALLAEKARRQLEADLQQDELPTENVWDLFKPKQIEQQVTEDLYTNDLPETPEIEVDKLPDNKTSDTNSLLEQLKSTVEAYKERPQNKRWRSPFSEDDEQEIKEYVQQHSKEDSDLTVEEQVALSIQDSDKVKSEAMAVVFEKQGNFQKALEIYKELSLKYPEKSSYFAAKIANINRKL